MDCPRKKRVVSENLQSQYQKDNRKGAKRTPYDESTAFGSEYEKTTATDLPHPSPGNALDERSAIGVPGEVVICQEIVEV